MDDTINGADENLEKGMRKPQQSKFKVEQKEGPKVGDDDYWHCPDNTLLPFQSVINDSWGGWHPP